MATTGVTARRRTTRPEGDSTVLTYDVRSNPLTTTENAKPGSGLAPIVTSSKYLEGPTADPCVTRLFATSRRPRPTRGEPCHQLCLGRGHREAQTDPQAGRRRERAPADGRGLRLFPRRRSADLQDGEGLLTAQRRVETYAYDATNKYVLQSATEDSGAGHLNLTTAFTFDQVGNLIATATPLAHVKTYTWDADRRLVFSLSPLIATYNSSVTTKYSYDIYGQLTEVDKGTSSPPSGSGFVAQETTAFAYDAAGNEIRQTVYDGGATTQPRLMVTQLNYDADDRPLCTAVRNNAAVFGALPAACVQSAADPDGPDLITKPVFDIRQTRRRRRCAVSAAPSRSPTPPCLQPERQGDKDQGRQRQSQRADIRWLRPPFQDEFPLDHPGGRDVRSQRLRDLQLRRQRQSPRLHPARRQYGHRLVRRPRPGDIAALFRSGEQGGLFELRPSGPAALRPVHFRDRPGVDWAYDLAGRKASELREASLSPSPTTRTATGRR